MPRRNNNRSGPLVVGIGASAGGISALQTFFDALGAVENTALVVIPHLDPNSESLLAELLARRTPLTVVQVTDDVPVESGHVYVIPPNRVMSIGNDALSLSRPTDPRMQRAPIDVFFRSLAELEARAIAVILSGGGSDGSVGARAVKERGGIVMVQDPTEAEHASMPNSAIEAGVVDVVAPLHELATRIRHLDANPHLVLQLPRDSEPVAADAAEPADDVALRAILETLRQRTDHDFTGYKKSTVVRRVMRRVHLTHSTDLESYHEVLESSRDEVKLLLKDLLISVTQFFRDPAAWETLETKALPALFDQRGAGSGIRAWSAGCATGEEAYSMAMVLLDLVRRRSESSEIVVFASDIDDSALETARRGRYPEAIALDVSPERLDRYFQPDGSHYTVRDELREHVVFASHGLLKHAPFSKLEVIICRNLLIYFDRQSQEQMFRLFHYALQPDGILFLGSAETADAFATLFEPLDKKHRIYRRLPTTSPVSRLPSLHLSGWTPRRGDRGVSMKPRSAVSPGDSHAAIVEQSAPPSILVDRDLVMLHLSASAGRYLKRPGGRPSDELIREIRHELAYDLQQVVQQAFEDGRSTTRGPIALELDGELRHVFLIGQTGAGDDDDLAVVYFVELDSHSDKVGEGPPAPSRANGLLREELSSLRQQMRRRHEEFETSQEEMMAANEELQSVNEEYKSTAEELETSGEELRSVNEELEAVNDELKLKVDELGRANSDLQNLMAATEIGTLFLDRELRIQRYTPNILALFNIVDSDRGRPVEHFTNVIDYDSLVDDARSVLHDSVPVECEVKSPPATWYLVRLRPYRNVDDSVDGVVVTFIDITQRKQAETELRELTRTLESRVEQRTAELTTARDLFSSVFHANPVPLVLTRAANGELVEANRAYREFVDLPTEDAFDEPAHLDYQWRDDAQRDHVREVLEVDGRVGNIEVSIVTHGGVEKTVLVFVERVEIAGEWHELSALIDMSERKEAERQSRLLASAVTIAEQAERQAREMASALTIAEQSERRRVSQILHDNLQQLLFGIRFKLSAIRETAEEGGSEQAIEAALESLIEVEGWLDEAIRETRRLTVELSPPVVEGEGLTDTVRWLAAQMQELHGLIVTIESRELHKLTNDNIRILLFQAIRELLFNVVKHAHTRRADVNITEADGCWQIVVADDGSGFDTTLDRSGRAGSGLRNVRERLRLLGGSLEIASSVGAGTLATISMPMSAGVSAIES